MVSLVLGKNYRAIAGEINRNMSTPEWLLVQVAEFTG